MRLLGIISLILFCFPVWAKHPSWKEIEAVTGPQKKLQTTRVVLFWASWCVICKGLLVQLEKEYKQNKSWRENVSFLTVNIDEKQKNYEEALKKNFHKDFATFRDNKKIFEIKRLKKIPATILYDETGEIRGYFYGAGVERISRIFKRINEVIKENQT